MHGPSPRMQSARRPRIDPADGLLRRLIERVARQDEAAFARFYDETSDRVFALALRVLQDRGAAEDCAAEVFLGVWRDASRYDASRSSPEVWLMVITRSRALDQLRRRGRNREVTGAAVNVETAKPRSESSDRPADPGQAGEPPPDLAEEASERAERIRAEVARLPAAQGRALRLAFFEGLSHSEIARRTDAPLGTVKTWISRGLHRLQDQLQPWKGDL